LKRLDEVFVSNKDTSILFVILVNGHPLYTLPMIICIRMETDSAME